MQERIVEIILFLVNELRLNKRLNDVDVNSLTREGYSQSEISSAFSWIFERLSLGQPLSENMSGARTSHRILNDAERLIIAADAYGYLIQCQQLGLLSNADVELMIERIMMAGFASVGVSEMKSFVAGFIFERESSTGKISLSINDTIH